MFFVLVICGFGVPIPEDLTLVTGGVISGLGYTNSHWMVVVGMLGVLAGDGFMFVAGRLWGQKILKFKPIARVMTPKRYAQVQEKIRQIRQLGIVRRPLPARFAYRRFRDCGHQPQSFLYPFHSDGRACRIDFRAGLDLFGRIRCEQHRLADGKNAQPTIRHLYCFGYIGSSVGMVLVEKTPTPSVLPYQVERKAGAAQSRQGSQKSRAKRTIKIKHPDKAADIQ